MASVPELRAPSSAAGIRLDTWLTTALPEISRSTAAELIEARRVRVDGKTRPKSFRLRGGERVLVEPLDAPIALTVEVRPEIVFEDRWLAIVDKPPGLVVYPAPGHRFLTLIELLAASASDWTPHAVHRLDRDTSGLMLIAKSEEARRKLQNLIRRRALERGYLALVAGRLTSRSGTIDAPLGRDRRVRTRMSTSTHAPRAARTHFEVEQLLPRATFVRVRLETGRTHQIRAHFAAIGHPLRGDRAYGGSPLGELDRQFLHSARIAFVHPFTNEQIERRSELPGDLSAALQAAKREP